MEMTTLMIRISRKLALAASLTAVVVGLGTGIAFAAGETDTDNISPASTAFTATSTNVTFSGTIDGVSFTVTCSTSTVSGKTPASGLGSIPITLSFSGCKDNHGGTDSITVTGATLKFIDAANDEATPDVEPNSGDQLQIAIPKGGGVFKTSALPGCTLTTNADTINGAYDDVSTVTFTNVSVPVSASGCFASTPTQSGSYKSNPGFHDVS